jgi:hypothetical protein
MEELDFAVAAELFPVLPSLLPGTLALLFGFSALVGSEAELSGFGDVGSSEHAENAPIIEIREPAKSHFFMFIRAILF